MAGRSTAERALSGPAAETTIPRFGEVLRHVNWEALASPLIQQIHRAAVGGIPDAGARQLLDEVLAYPGVPARWRTADAKAQSAPFLPMALRKGDLALRFFTTIATLGTPQDITLQELRVECFFPGDEATEEFARRLAGARDGASG